MKIGNVITLHTELMNLIGENRKFSPRFLFWAKSTSQKTEVVFKNLQESMQGLKSPENVEFEKKRTAMIESLRNSSVSEDEKQKKFSVDIKALMTEYDAAIKEFEAKATAFEEELFKEESDAVFSKVSFNELPELTFAQMQAFYQLVDPKGRIFKEREIQFSSILSITSIKEVEAFSNKVKYALVSLIEGVADKYTEFAATRKKYNTNEAFGQYSIEKTQAATDSSTTEEQKKIVIAEIEAKYPEIVAVERELDAMISSSIKCNLCTISIDDLPSEGISPKVFNSLEVLVLE